MPPHHAVIGSRPQYLSGKSSPRHMFVNDRIYDCVVVSIVAIEERGCGMHVQHESTVKMATSSNR